MRQQQSLCLVNASAKTHKFPFDGSVYITQVKRLSEAVTSHVFMLVYGFIRKAAVSNDMRLTRVNPQKQPIIVISGKIRRTDGM